MLLPNPDDMVECYSYMLDLKHILKLPVPAKLHLDLLSWMDAAGL